MPKSNAKPIKLKILKNNSNEDPFDRFSLKYLREIRVRKDPRFIPVRVYVSTDEYTDYLLIKDCLITLLTCEALIHNRGYEKPARKGSWFQELIVVAARFGQLPKTKERLRKIERTIEQKALGIDGANINKAHADAAASLISSLSNTDEAVIQVGTIVLVKQKNKDGSSRIGVVNLTHEQLAIIQNNPGLLMSPSCFYDAISESGTQALNEEMANNKVNKDASR